MLLLINIAFGLLLAQNYIGSYNNSSTVEIESDPCLKTTLLSPELFQEVPHKFCQQAPLSIIEDAINWICGRYFVIVLLLVLIYISGTLHPERERIPLEPYQHVEEEPSQEVEVEPSHEVEVEPSQEVVVEPSQEVDVEPPEQGESESCQQVHTKLSQQVPLWTVEEVVIWVKQIGFIQYSQEFHNSWVDGDLLLQLSEKSLLDDIGISNGILRKRFLRELNRLKREADYSSCDTSSLGTLLKNLGPDFYEYTYQLLKNGINMNNIIHVTPEQLLQDCGIRNSIHRTKIMQAIKSINRKSSISELSEREISKTFDIFISYRRSNGSELASLLKVHFENLGYKTFLDVESLRNGKFPCGIINSIERSLNFLPIFTPNALDRCMGDENCEDWVHKEIVVALKSRCNIVPVVSNQFQWPQPESLPEDIREIITFNVVSWSHEYQDASVGRIVNFMVPERNVLTQNLERVESPQRKKSLLLL